MERIEAMDNCTKDKAYGWLREQQLRLRWQTRDTRDAEAALDRGHILDARIEW